MNPVKLQAWLAIAESVSALSKDETKVGALLIGPDGETILSGYNGPVRGENDQDPEVWANKGLHVKHAETNLLLTAARLGIRVQGCTLVVTKCPCLDCALNAVQAGIARVCSPAPDTSSRWTDSQQLALNKLLAFGVEVCLLDDRPPGPTPFFKARHAKPSAPWGTYGTISGRAERENKGKTVESCDCAGAQIGLKGR